MAELTRNIRAFLEARFPDLWVEGELSNFKPHGSGHWYFTLRDEEAQLRAVMFRSQNLRLRFVPEDGMQVLCRGRITVYEKRGEYQLIVEEMEPRGAGALLAAFEALKAKLAAEGLFDSSRKRALPLLPRRVGIVTSPSGAAVRDMLKVIRRRDPRMPVLVCPVRVQGDGAAQEIADGIDRLGRSGLVDVIIAGRGGGSVEDLWAFNEEVVARAIAACPVPLVSAVGHETDFTIADFVADERAPTPSAAAELVVPVRADLARRVRELEQRAARAMRRRWGELGQQLRALRGRLADPRRLLDQHRMRLDDALGRARAAMDRRLAGRRRELGRLAAALRQRHPAAAVARWHRTLQDLRGRLDRAVTRRLGAARRASEVLAGKLQALSPLAILRRGYAIARRADGHVLSRARDARPGEALHLLLGEGELEVRVERMLDDAGRPNRQGS